MIAILNSYSELLNKLDMNEKTESIYKTIEDIKEEAIMYEEKYSTAIFIIKKLFELKNDNTHEDFECYLRHLTSEKEINNKSHLYSLPEINNEDDINNMSDPTKKDIKLLPKNDQIHEINHMIHKSILNMNEDNEDEKIDTIKELKSLKSKL